MDDLAEKIARATAELEAALGKQPGQIDFEFVHAEEVTVSGDRIGFARLAIDLLRAAAPPAASDANQLPEPDSHLLSSPITDYKRTDGSINAESTATSWKDRLFAAGCFLVGAVAIMAFFRGCVALERDIERLLN
jgi:hypothetical protein